MTLDEIEARIKDLRTAADRIVAECNAAVAQLEAEAIDRNVMVGEVGQIMIEVAREYGVAVAALKGPARQHPIYVARAEAMRRIRQTNRYSLPQIGRFFGDRDHTTVMHAIRQAELRRQMGNFPVMSSDQRVTNRYGQ